MKHAKAYVCVVCNGFFIHFKSGVRCYCDECMKLVSEQRKNALWRVNSAVKSGRLPRPDTQICVDCGDKAKM